MGSFILNAAVAILINLITAIFSRDIAFRLIPWISFYIGLHLVYVLLKQKYVRQKTMELAKILQPQWLSYLLVMITAAILAGIYWRGINFAVSQLDNAASGQDNTKLIKIPPALPQQENVIQASPPTQKPSAEVIPKPPPAAIPQAIVVQLPSVGNLKQRAISLSNEIMDDLCRHGWIPSRGVNPYLNPDLNLGIRQFPTAPEAHKRWMESRSGYFKWKFFEAVRDIRNEFAQLHIRDQMLDDFIKYQDMDKNTRREMAAVTKTQMPEIHMSASEIETIAERLIVLAEQIKTDSPNPTNPQFPPPTKRDP